MGSQKKYSTIAGYKMDKNRPRILKIIHLSNLRAENVTEKVDL